ncbi:uncharacterized protein RCO7_05805 [Rhynchosporium graminicola]|uniref:SAP domain-containing protein n=1 Tax=Rhynchosporium graminicola TaxID=2792576 RepID=A0A1E1KB60_9HELO|nr:uncharacterized protein RCO7_05805 [Rhynchosporium commune]
MNNNNNKNYNQHAVHHLKSTCKTRGLSATGNKGDLVRRLVEDDRKLASAVAVPVYNFENDPKGFHRLAFLNGNYQELHRSSLTADEAIINTLTLRIKKAKSTMAANQADLAQAKDAKKQEDLERGKHESHLNAECLEEESLFVPLKDSCETGGRMDATVPEVIQRLCTENKRNHDESVSDDSATNAKKISTGQR